LISRVEQKATEAIGTDLAGIQVDHDRQIGEAFQGLQAALPTAEELAQEFPLLSLVKLRIDIERQLRALAEETGVVSEGPMGLNELIRASEGVRQLPSTAKFMRIVDVLHKAAHGVEVPRDDADTATEISQLFLAEIQEYRASR
jgi:hypothetical protein